MEAWLIRPKEARRQDSYSHDELPKPDPRSIYVFLLAAIPWRVLAAPLFAAFDAEVGRPTDPVVFLKIFIVGYLENIVFDTELAERIHDSVAIRAFLGYGLGEETPDHSTISLVRAQIAEHCDVAEVLAQVVKLCADAGLVDGVDNGVDSSLVPANAGMASLRHKESGKKLREQLRDVAAAKAAAAGSEGEAAAEGGQGAGQKGEGRPRLSNKEYRSQTDPSARIASKPGQLRDLYYRVTHITSGKGQIILAARAGLADEGETKAAEPLVEAAATVLEDNSLEPGRLAGDAGYDDADFHAHAEAQGFEPVTNYEKDTSKKPEGFKKADFQYNEADNSYTCPGGQTVKCRSNGEKEKRYESEAATCATCPLREQCLEEGAQTRWLYRSANEASRERNIARCHTEEGRAALKARSHTVEPPFGHLKAYGGGRVINCRGVDKANVKIVFAAAAWNLTRLAKYAMGTEGRRKKGARATPSGRNALWGGLVRLLQGPLERLGARLGQVRPAHAG